MSQGPNASLEAAVKDALVIARGDPEDEEEQKSITPFVRSTAAQKDSGTVYRLFEAAASWLGTDAYLISKGEKGVQLSDLEGVKAELRAQQYAEDMRLGLLPTNFSTSIFAGVAR